MALDPVVLGGPHVAAHNAERAMLNDHDTKISTDIPASIATVAGLPSYVGPRTKLFDPTLSLYNSNVDKLRSIRAGVSRARKGGTYKITCIGDSTTASSGADYLNGYPMQLRSMIAASGAPIKGTGAVFAGQGITDPRWTSTGTNTSFGAYCQLSAGATRTFTSDLPGDSVVIRFYRNSGTWTVKVDGAIIGAGQVAVVGGSYNATTGTITPDGVQSIGSVTITGLTASSHVVLVTAVGSFFYISIKVELSAGSGISVSNMGVASTKTSNWTATGFVTNYQMATAEAADLFIVSLGINDNNTITPATTAANLTTLVTNLLAIAPVLLVSQHNNSGFTAASQQAYVSAMYDVADALNVPLVDLMYHWGSYFNMNTWGLTADAVHPNSKGYNDWAATLYAAIVLGASNVLSLSTSKSWAANSQFNANQLVRLPTGGLGYSPVDYTSRATFDATERDAWIFLPGGHVERLTGAGNWKCPLNVTQAQVVTQAGGGGGGGGGSATAGTGTLQVGGGGGGAGTRNEFVVTGLVPGTNYAYSAGGAGLHGNGGAIGGAGTAGGNGGDSTFTGPGGTIYRATGGSGGGNSAANSTAAATGGYYGVASTRTTIITPGCGGVTSNLGGFAPMPTDNVVGGSGGGTATATLGGAGGPARTSPGAMPAAVGTGGSASVIGQPGITATEPGCGGGGGGGGSGSGTGGAGGNGGDGAAGYVEMRF